MAHLLVAGDPVMSFQTVYHQNEIYVFISDMRMQQYNLSLVLIHVARTFLPANRLLHAQFCWERASMVPFRLTRLI